MMESQAKKGRISFKDALVSKYSFDDDENDENLCFIHIGGSPKHKACFDQSEHYQKRIVTLDGHGINCAGPVGEIASICPNVEELDLAKNDLSDFREVFQIISQLQKLEFLNLSENYLSQRIDDLTPFMGEHCKESLASIKKLILNNTAMPLETVYSLLNCLTGVQDLYLSLNGYESIPDSPEQYPSIRSLSINKHVITQWDEIGKLGFVFPGLIELRMSECPLENIIATEIPQQFPNLKVLNLNDTLLDTWEAIEALKCFPGLTDVSLMGIPLLDQYSDQEKRQLLVARLPNIKKLNKTGVTQMEREDAERFFIRHHMDDESPPSRYHELVNTYGVLDRLAEVNLKPKESAVISFIYDDEPLFKREINLMQSTTSLKKYLSEIVGLPPSGFKILYHDVEFCFALDEMKYGPKKLYTYNMRDGDEIHVWSR
ncbi:tubulin-specific chaperone cofactor E-like protein [Oculina patagonica]